MHIDMISRPVIVFGSAVALLAAAVAVRRILTDPELRKRLRVLRGDDKEAPMGEKALPDPA